MKGFINGTYFIVRLDGWKLSGQFNTHVIYEDTGYIIVRILVKHEELIKILNMQPTMNEREYVLELHDTQLDKVVKKGKYYLTKSVIIFEVEQTVKMKMVFKKV